MVYAWSSAKSALVVIFAIQLGWALGQPGFNPDLKCHVSPDLEEARKAEQFNSVNFAPEKRIPFEARLVQHLPDRVRSTLIVIPQGA